MSKIIVLLQFVLALFGVDLGTHYSNRVSDHGVDTLFSTAHVEAGIARFQCVTSASGMCHYTLFRADCPPTPQAGANDNCAPGALKRFTVVAGNSKQVTGLPAFNLCVDSDDASPTPDCKPIRPIARQ